MSVIHGTGKPRILSTETPVITDVVNSLGAGFVKLDTDYTTNMNNTYGTGNWTLVNRWIETFDANNDNIYAKITSVDNSDIQKLYIDQWYGGDIEVANEPVAGHNIFIKGFIVELPYCENLTEQYELDARMRKLENGKMRIDKRGWWYRAVLNYQSFIKKTVLQSLEFVFNLGENDFYFIPRADNPDIFYQVNFPEDYSLQFSQLRQHDGHSGINIVLVGMQRLRDINLTSEPVYHAYGYGEYYGYYH